jgi:hypothetical protein
MSLRYRYRLEQLNRPIVTLGGRTERPRPILPVTLIGPADSRLRDGLLDSGADDTMLPESLAPVLGIDLTNAPQAQASGVGNVAVAVRYALVTFRLIAGSERREWTALVGFTSVPLKRPLYGFAGFLQFFTAKFEGDLEEVELTVNSLYPGT